MMHVVAYRAAAPRRAGANAARAWNLQAGPAGQDRRGHAGIARLGRVTNTYKYRKQLF